MDSMTREAAGGADEMTETAGDEEETPLASEETF